ncbi:MAG TPA: hypothetical protein VGO11_15030 [Chthoniobacteraceae bacterium]|jgi:hypothetical protein|nr:hypothetical protein [Chthoniobacteraceae bacterium]
MPKYDLQSNHFAGLEEDRLDAATIDALWQLFVRICERWQNVPSAAALRTRWLGFLSNRIEIDPLYVTHYRNAVAVIEELKRQPAIPAAYEFLLTDAEANNAPPQTPLQRTRQSVANEFIAFQLSVGGFKEFTGALNYPGYIAGWNGDGPAPYRTYED